VALLAWGSRSDRVTIQNIEIKGAEYVKEDSLLFVVEEEISGKYFWLFPKGNILIYPKKNILANVLKYKRIDGASIYMKDLDTVVLSVTERKPAYLWCAEEEKTGGGEENYMEEKCFFMDKNGYIFDEAAYFSNSVFFKFYGGMSGDPIGNTFLSVDEFSKILIFKDALEEFGISSHIFRALPGGDYKFVTGGGGAVIFHKKQDLQKVLENLKSAMSVSDLSDSLAGANLDYIDLRFGNKVFYKFEGEDIDEQ